jgi:hypothetical protein
VGERQLMALPNLNVIQWAAQECEWQGSGEMSVLWMIQGWQFAVEHANEPITLDHILVLGATVEPRYNINGIRQIGVRVGFSVKPRPDEVPAMLDRLIEHQPDIPVDDPKLAVEWFREFEEIHIFRDGNGRVGNVLYNWLFGTLDTPVYPPNLWNDPRR